MTAAIECRGVTKRYPHFSLDVDLTVLEDRCVLNADAKVVSGLSEGGVDRDGRDDVGVNDPGLFLASAVPVRLNDHEE